MNAVQEVSGHFHGLETLSESITMFIKKILFSTTGACVALTGVLGALSAPRQGGSCRYIPGDPGWPNNNQWRQLNQTVNGRLIATIPLAEVCHDPYYNAISCSELAAVWDRPETQKAFLHSNSPLRADFIQYL